MTIQQMLLGTGGGADDSFVDWGGGTPVWNTQTGYLRYTNINNPSMSYLDINSHYGMTTDSWNRYLIFTNRNAGGVYGDRSIWGPIVGTAGGGLGSVYPDFSARFGVINLYGNYFGGMADTTRGRFYLTEYANGYIIGHDLPAVLSNLSAGEYSTSAISGGTTYDLGNPTGWPMSGGSYTSWPGTGACDGGYHDGWNDIYYFVGRDTNIIYYYNPNTSTWANTGAISSIPSFSGLYHGVCKDPSSNHFVYAIRNGGFYMSNGISGSCITTYGTGGMANNGVYAGNHSYPSNVMPNDVEDVVIAWNGDIFCWGKSSQNQLTQFQRTA